MVGIAGIGIAFPKKVVDTWETYAVPKGIRREVWEKMGCHSSYVLEKPMTPTDLGIQAAQKAMAEAGVEAGEIDVLISNCYNSEYLYWQLSGKLQEQLGCDQAYAYDVFGGCNAVGSVVRSAMDLFTSDDEVETVLIVLSEAVSGETWPQFISDGACALVLRRDHDELVLLSHSQVSDIFPTFQRLPIGGTVDPFTSETHFEGNIYENFEFTATHYRQEIKPIIYPSCKLSIEEAVAKAGCKMGDLKQVFFVHQQKNVNQKMLEMFALPANLSPVDYIDDMGHVSGSDVFIALKRAMQDGRVKKGDLMAFEVMGMMDFHAWVIRY